jgi:hypothetical protein
MEAGYSKIKFISVSVLEKKLGLLIWVQEIQSQFRPSSYELEPAV